MTKIAEHTMRLQPAPFEKIKSGEKTIELRLWDEKRRKIRVGDAIAFVNTTTAETLRATVVCLHRFGCFDELYRALPLLRCGYTPETVQTAQPSDMEQYYTPAEQARYGVVGIEIILNND